MGTNRAMRVKDEKYRFCEEKVGEIRSKIVVFTREIVNSPKRSLGTQKWGFRFSSVSGVVLELICDPLL